MSAVRGYRAFAVCMGMDALRLCLGQEPKTFSVAEVVRWIKTVDAASRTGGR